MFIKFSTIKAAFISLLAAVTPLDDSAEYFDQAHRKTTSSKGLGKFDEIWDYEADWFESPNARRGGWSGVNRIATVGEEGKTEPALFLKRQQNHVRRTLFRPISGIPTFVREFKMLQYLRQHQLNVPKPVYFGIRNAQGNQQAILLTEELHGYRSLEETADEMFKEQRPRQNVQTALISSLASAVRQLHDAGVQHRSLYPKHIFVKQNSDLQFEIAFIDLEKSRLTFSDTHRTYKDLGALNRHAGDMWSKTKRLYFFKHYLGIQRLTPATKKLCRAIIQRSSR